MRTFFRLNDWPLAVKLIFAFLIVSLVPLLIVIYIAQDQARAGLLSEARRNIGNISESSGRQINTVIERHYSQLVQIAVQTDVRQFTDLTVTNRQALRPTSVAFLNTLQVLQSSATNPGDYIMIISGAPNGSEQPLGKVELTSNAGGATPEGQPTEFTSDSARNGTNVGVFAQYQKAFKAALSGNDSYVSPPFIVSRSADRIDSAFIVARSIYPPTSDTTRPGNLAVGVIMSVVSMREIEDIVERDAAKAGTGSFASLIDPAGMRVGDSRARQKGYAPFVLYDVLRPQTEAEHADSLTRVADLGEPHKDFLPGVADTTKTLDNRFFTTDLRGNTGDITQPAQASFYRLDGPAAWVYLVVVPNATFEAAATNIADVSRILLIASIALVVLAALLLTRLLTRPIREIRQVLGRIGIGDFEARVPVRGHDEIGVLGENLNAMFDNTLSLIQTREEKDELQTDIMKLLNEISTVADGDLTVQAEVTTSVTGNIADAFNGMIEELRKVITNIQISTAETNIILEQLLRGSRHADEAADRQARRIAAVTTQIAEVNRAGRDVAASAADSADVAQIARQNARQGGMAVNQTIDGMHRIRANVQETSKKVKRLAESSQQIGEIVKLIDDIADQTKMLALNAAIQAAMAGEQGKGFTVVAEEVRRLAERAANATNEISGLVKSIQDDTAEAVISMEETTREVVDGSSLADEAGRSLRDIETVVTRLADLILGISHLSQNQSLTTNEIAQSTIEIGRLTQEATHIRRASAIAMQKLAHSAADLRGSVSTFRLVDNTENNVPSLIAPNDPILGELSAAYPSLGSGAADGGSHETEEITNGSRNTVALG